MTAPRLAYDLDGTVLLDNGVSSTLAAQLNSESVDNVTAVASHTWLWIFPAVTQLSTFSVYTDGGGTFQVSTSRDTTNGSDGTWSAPLTGACSTQPGGWLSGGRQHLSPPPGIALRLAGITGSAGTPPLCMVHLYGTASDADVLAFWDPVLDVALPPAALIFDGIAEQSVDVLFRLKNVSSTYQASGVSVSLLDSAVGAPGDPTAPPVPSSGDKFSDDFTSFDTSAKWYPCYPYASGGAVDEGSGASWNAGTNPIGGAVYHPFAVVSDASATNGTVLQISCRRTTGAEQSDAGGKNWVGGITISQQSFTYGYIEWRMKLPNPGQGMFPALWVFGAVTGTQDDFAHKNAEMDMLEVFGVASGTPWNTTLHLKDGSGSGAVHQLSAVSDDTTGWHTYGIDWQVSTLRFYKDGVETANGDAYAAFYQGLHLQLRMNYTTGAGLSWMPNPNTGTPSPLTMLVDYVNVYTTRPASVGTLSALSAPPPPTPASQFFLSPADDQGLFTATLDLGDLGPGEVTSAMVLRQATTVTPSTDIAAFRLVATPTVWVPSDVVVATDTGGF